MSELRQQLRKRGLPVSGTKPALLERLRPFQLPRPQLTPAPLCKLEGTLEPSPRPNLSPSRSPSQIYIQPSPVMEESLAGATYLTSPSSSAGSSPKLQAPSPPMPSSAFWRSEQAAEELTVELEMRERIRSRPRGKALGAVTQARTNITVPSSNVNIHTVCIHKYVNRLSQKVSIKIGSMTNKKKISIADKWKYPPSFPATGPRMRQRETRHRRTRRAVYTGENTLAIKLQIALY